MQDLHKKEKEYRFFFLFFNGNIVTIARENATPLALFPKVCRFVGHFIPFILYITLFYTKFDAGTLLNVGRSTNET